MNLAASLLAAQTRSFPGHGHRLIHSAILSLKYIAIYRWLSGVGKRSLEWPSNAMMMCDCGELQMNGGSWCGSAGYLGLHFWTRRVHATQLTADGKFKQLASTYLVVCCPGDVIVSTQQKPSPDRQLKLTPVKTGGGVRFTFQRVAMSILGFPSKNSPVDCLIGR